MSLFLSFRHRCSRFTFCFTITATIELSSTISFGSKSTLSQTVTDAGKNLLCLHETFLYFGAFCNWQTIIPNYFILPLCLLVEWLLSLRHHSCLMWIQTSGRLGCRYARTIGAWSRSNWPLTAFSSADILPFLYKILNLFLVTRFFLLYSR